MKLNKHKGEYKAKGKKKSRWHQPKKEKKKTVLGGKGEIIVNEQGQQTNSERKGLKKKKKN